MLFYSTGVARGCLFSTIQKQKADGISRWPSALSVCHSGSADGVTDSDLAPKGTVMCSASTPYPRYSEEDQRIAIEYSLSHRRNFTAAIRDLRFPASRYAITIYPLKIRDVPPL